MRLTELPGILDESLAYPTDLQTVRDQIGELELDAPDQGDTRTVGAVLNDIEVAKFATAAELYESIFANLPEGYVGRKYYSDRGGHVEGEVEGWSGDPHRSF